MKDAPTRAHEPWKAFRARQRNPDIKRDAVLQTAAHMFLEQGYRRTSMSELAQRLRITKPALYYYFRNKEELLVECYRAGITLIETLLDKALVSSGTGLTKVKAYIHAYATSIVLYDFGRCVAMLDENELSSETRREVRALKRRIDAAIRAYIEEGIADKSIAPCNAMLASFAMAGAINGIGAWYKPAGPLTGQEIAAQYTDLITEGLRAQTSASTRSSPVPGRPRSTSRKSSFIKGAKTSR
jgi:AcrR family transcriptional regulator